MLGPVASGAASCRRPGRPFAATSGERPPVPLLLLQQPEVHLHPSAQAAHRRLLRRNDLCRVR